jgi:hypothetical protein
MLQVQAKRQHAYAGQRYQASAATEGEVFPKIGHRVFR